VEWFNPGRWLLYLCAMMALLLGLCRAFEAIEERGYNRAVSEYTIKSSQQLAKAQRQHELVLIEVNNARLLKEKQLSELVARNSAIATSLREQLAADRNSLSALTRDAVDNYARTASSVFQECAGKYIEVAEQADRIASDREALIKTWPHF